MEEEDKDTHGFSNPLKIAVIYTGQIRTLENTLPYFIENVLNNNISDKHKVNKTVHVFATIELPSSEEEKAYYESLLVSNMGDHIKSLVWLDRNDSEWIKIRERLLKNMNIHEQTKHYLRTSGSMIEHYQTYLSSQSMINYENFITSDTGIDYKYDFVERVRTDIVICDPLDYTWIIMDRETIIKRLDKQVSFMKINNDFLENENIEEDKNKSNNNKLLTYFMTSLVNENRYKTNEINETNGLVCICSTMSKKDEDKIITKTVNNEKCINMDELRKYILDGDYIITFRSNLLYFTNRKCFGKISLLGIEYGTHSSINTCSIKDPLYFWNSESQFETICSDNGISVFNSDNKIEAVSLYGYEKSNYFDENNKLKKRDDLFYFLMRSF